MRVDSDGHVVLVTGGASGIGRACAEAFARAGADGVVVADIDKEAAADAARSISGPVLGVEADVTDEAAVNAVIAGAVDRFGRLDVIVTAAGVTYAGYRPGIETQAFDADDDSRLLHNRPVSDWALVLEVNLTGTMLCCRAAARHMIPRRTGCIITIGSLNSTHAVPRAADYCVSKAGVWMLTKCLALELGPYGIRVNAIAPGFIETPMTERFRRNQRAVDEVVNRTPARRFGSPEDVADVALFLASHAARFVTGALVPADGGLGRVAPYG